MNLLLVPCCEVDPERSPDESEGACGVDAESVDDGSEWLLGYTHSHASSLFVKATFL